MRSGVMCYRTFLVTAGLAIHAKRLIRLAYRRLVVGKKLGACGGSEGAMIHSRNLLRKQLTARSPPTQILMLEWHDENSEIIRFDRMGGRRDRR